MSARRQGNPNPFFLPFLAFPCRSLPFMVKNQRWFRDHDGTQAQTPAEDYDPLAAEDVRNAESIPSRDPSPAIGPPYPERCSPPCLVAG